MVDGRQDHVMSKSRELLCVAMVVMWSQVTEVTASPQPLKSAIFHTLPVSDITFTQDVLWEKPARSKMHCGRKCGGEAGCSMFTFTPSTDGPGGSCRIHGKRQTPQGQQESAPGARSYNIVITDFWIEKACTNSSDCTEPLAAYYSGQCLCVIGFFFDYFQNACVSNCTRSLEDSYVEYKDIALKFNNYNLTIANHSVSTCRSACLVDPKCIGFTFRIQKVMCIFKTFVAQDSPGLVQYSPDSTFYYHRTCV